MEIIKQAGTRENVEAEDACRELSVQAVVT